MDGERFVWCVAKGCHLAERQSFIGVVAYVVLGE